MVTAASGLLTACSGEADGTGDSTGSRAAGTGDTAVVERGTLDTVTTVSATVKAGPEAQIAAPGAGTVTRVSDSGVAFALDSGKTVTLDLPAAVKVTDKLVSAGRRVPANYPVAKAKVTGFALVARLDVPTLYEMYEPPLAARGQIKKGPGPFDCPLVNTVPTASDAAAAADADAGENGGTGAKMSMICVVPGDLKVFTGMPGIMALQTSQVKNALMLPVEAVAGTSQRGKVTVVAGGGSTQERTVKLGPSDGSRIQILSGVREGERVRVPAPDLAGTPGGDE